VIFLALIRLVLNIPVDSVKIRPVTPSIYTVVGSTTPPICTSSMEARCIASRAKLPFLLFRIVFVAERKVCREEA